MADTRKIIRVFLASPGDLQDERRAAKAVVDEFNKLWADALGYHVELVGWEDTTSQYGRPQGVINQDLEKCELVIGVMWKRWGTRPSKAGPYTSGFEEEFETSLTSRRVSGRPELALLFKEVDKELLRDPGDELKKVLLFKDRIVAEKEILFEQFKDHSEFEGKIRACITTHIQRLRQIEAQKLSSETQSTPIEKRAATEGDGKPARSAVIAAEAASFLRTFLAPAESRDASDRSLEVARFRLVATTITEQGNDEITVGPHDSNLLFIHRSTLSLENREKAGLIRSGLDHFSSENVPLWYWYAQMNGFQRHLFAYYASSPKTHGLQANALAAMRIIEESLPVSSKFPRDFFLHQWFGADASDDQMRAALGYLSECGLPEDLPTIKKEFERGNYQTRSTCVDAIIRINLREGCEQAIKALYELQPNSIEKQLLADLFQKHSSLDEEILTEGTNHRSPLVRQTTASILAKRNQLQLSDAERLLSDADEDVRYVAMCALLKHGRTFSEEQARAALLRQVSAGLLGSLGGQAGVLQFSRFKETTLAAKTDAELEALLASASIFDRAAQFTLLKRHFSSRKDQLADLIEDQFKTNFTNSMATMITRYGEDSQLVKDTRGLETFLRKEFTRQALDIVCKLGGPEYLRLIRQALESEFVDYSRLDVEYLQKYGEWRDIPLIIAATGRSEAGVSLAGSDYGSKYRSAAKAMYAIGKDRLPELLGHEMPKTLLERLIVEVSDKSFRTLENDQIRPLLLDADDSVRKACALKAVRSLPRKRLSRILDEYVGSEDQRYYNVIHWLDLGVSVPRHIAQRAAVKVIAKQWPDDGPIVG